ncbi:MAG: D-alanine--D-alanine ligase [Candidatus Sericytochromatia bacterium]|nr:D-alanine--D-alanine ligase [Candidatus Sericytochromatia bacterium]
MSKLRVAVLMGGPSSEREVSLRSGQMVLKNLDPERYEPFAVELNDLLASPLALADLAARADFVFLALHGRGGEDGTIQGLLDVFGLPYQGSGVTASAFAMNKVRAKSIFTDLKIPQARYLDWRRTPSGLWQRGHSRFHRIQTLEGLTGQAVETEAKSTLGAELVIKGATQGSSLGLKMVGPGDEFIDALTSVAQTDDEILIEERIRGIEVTAAVIGSGENLQALPLVEIRPRTSEIFDYQAKYTPGATDELCPAQITEELTARIQQMALWAHHGLACSGASRSDFIIRDEEPYILEINTLPGLTEGSLLPQAARAAGVMLPDLLDLLVTEGLERKRKQNVHQRSERPT